MMRVALHIDYSEGLGADVTATAPDLIAFERHFDKSFTVFADDLRVEYLLWLAWHTVKRKKQTKKEFDDWCDEVESITIGETADPVPLESSQPTGS